MACFASVQIRCSFWIIPPSLKYFKVNWYTYMLVLPHLQRKKKNRYVFVASAFSMSRYRDSVFRPFVRLYVGPSGRHHVILRVIMKDFVQRIPANDRKRISHIPSSLIWKCNPFTARLTERVLQTPASRTVVRTHDLLHHNQSSRPARPRASLKGLGRNLF